MHTFPGFVGVPLYRQGFPMLEMISHFLCKLVIMHTQFFQTFLGWKALRGLGDVDPLLLSMPTSHSCTRAMLCLFPGARTRMFVLRKSCPLYLHMAAAPATLWFFFFFLFSSLLPFATANASPLLNCEPSTACASQGKKKTQMKSCPSLKSQLKFSCAFTQQRIQLQLLRHILLFSTVGRMSCAKGMSQEQPGKRTIVPV